jgi:hypothetical protein
MNGSQPCPGYFLTGKAFQNIFPDGKMLKMQENKFHPALDMTVTMHT